MDLPNEFVKKFNAGSLLRSDELTNTFNYIRERDKESRYALDGAGIAYGLVPTLQDGVLTISEGAGVTSDGHLIYCKEHKFRFYAPTIEGQGTATGFPLSFTGENKNYQALSVDFLKDKCIFLYLKTSDSDKKDCSLRTGQENDVCEEEVKVLVGTKPLVANTETKLCLLHTPCLVRLGTKSVQGQEDVIDFSSFTSTEAFQKNYEDIIKKNIDEIVKAYKSVEDKDCYKELFCGASFQDIEKNLTGLLSIPLFHPYCDDYLKTLAAAYLEFENTEGVSKNRKIISRAAFPNYLALGNYLDCECRQSWQPSPANLDTNEEAKFYAKRMVELVNKELPIHITPSHSASMPLSEQAIPFYFKSMEVRKYWHFKRSKLNLTQDTPAYDDTPNKILCSNTEGYDFYRIEGHIGQKLEVVLSQLKDLKRQRNIAFNVIPLYIGDIEWDINDGGIKEDDTPKPNCKPSNQGVNASAIPIDDLEREFQQHKLDILCWLWQFDNPRNETLSNLVKSIDEMSFADFTFKNDIRKDIFDDNKIEDNKFFAPSFIELSGRAKFCRFDYLKLVERIHRARLQLTSFKNFTHCFSGTEPVGGVPVGETFIVLYDIKKVDEGANGKRFTIFEQTVVGDMMLPCCELDLKDVPTAAFSLEFIREFILKGSGKDKTVNNTGNIKVFARNLSVNAHQYEWEAKSVPSFNIPIINDGNNATIQFSEEVIKKIGPFILTVTLTAKKEGKTSVYSETLDIPEKKPKQKENAVPVSDPTPKITTTTKPSIDIEVKTPVGEELKIPTPPVGEVTGLTPVPDALQRTRPVSSPQLIIGDEPLKNVASFNQRHDSYKKIIAEIETDPSINDNKAFNLTKVFVFFPKPKANLMANFDEATHALFASIHRSKKEEQKRKFIYLLKTTTHFYLDKMVAAGEKMESAVIALDNVKSFMVKNGINTIEFIVDWKVEAIENQDNKEVVAQIKQIFE
jgi:hypothetical protein